VTDQHPGGPQEFGGRYTIQRELGRGGMAVVYLAHDSQHKREVALKLFRIDSGLEEGKDRFLREIQIAARLAHPNILPVHDSGESEGLLYYVMPHVPGENLAQRLARQGALPVHEAMQIAAQVAGALAYAHSLGVVHRDIKPDNILFLAGQAVVADFGVARAISAGGWDETQLLGMVVGTPAYMSPEQAAGGSRVDGRSDIYSLGCVLYEMLTGVPPFRATTPDGLAAQHRAEEPEPVTRHRPALSPELEQLVGRALAKHPADRYQTAQQFADLLQPLATPEIRATPVGLPAPRLPLGLSWRIPWGWAIAGVLAVILAVARITDQPPFGGRVDPALHLVAPFAHRADAAPLLLTGDQCSRLVHNSLARWQDVSLADSRWTTDQLERLGREPSLEDLLRIARRAGAGRLISGEVWSWGDSIRVRGVLYDVNHRGRMLREQTFSVAGDLSDAEARFAELADSLLLPRAQAPVAVPGALGTRVLGAWVAYDSGHAALAAWDLEGAAAHFRTALERDPGFALAHLWLAQTASWQGQPASLWRAHAQAGVGAPAALPPRELAWGLALAALAEGRFPEACAQYDSIVHRDSLDFRGWYGRAECRARDRLVLADAGSPSGWRFRSSHRQAIRDYQHALTLIPSAHRAFRGAAFDRLGRLLYTQTNQIRWGEAGSPDAGYFSAWPALQGDTLAFVPYPVARFGAIEGAELYPASNPAAVNRNREVLRQIADAWVREFPRSGAALEAQGIVLEMQGLLDAPTAESAALARYVAAERLASDTAMRLRLALARTRVLLKLDRLREAETLAESVLATRPADAEAATQHAALAALTGQPSRAAALLRLSASGYTPMDTAGRELSVPLRLRETALSVIGFAAVGTPSDSLRRLLDDGERQVRAFAAPEDRASVNLALFSGARAQLFPAPLARLNEEPPASEYLLALQAAFRRGDTAGVRSRLAALTRARRHRTPGTVAPDFALQEAQLYLAMRDSAAAVARLDDLLVGLPSLGRDLFTQPLQAGALVRAMALRARLASRLAQPEVAARWAVSVLRLWKAAEPALAPELAEMRRLAAEPS